MKKIQVGQPMIDYFPSTNPRTQQGMICVANVNKYGKIGDIVSATAYTPSLLCWQSKIVGATLSLNQSINQSTPVDIRQPQGTAL